MSVYDVNTKQKVLTHEVFQYERVHGIITAKPEEKDGGNCEKKFLLLSDKIK